MVTLIRTDAENDDLLSLVALLDEELKLRDGEDHYFFAQFNKLAGIIGAVVAYVNDEPIGCGAFKRFSDTEAEIKRMFVKPESRGQRIAANILTELESWAQENQFTACVLETGFKQPEAIALYKRSGYTVIPNYGQYSDVSASVCMRKGLNAAVAYSPNS
ncbi:MAG: GNAT family N-acetyltransferase [Acidobacteria bacterium]|nr:GNAT family N-acetyltransferase [Acidobacteriota bacterium]MBK9528531.1 GNAT family N-acetyltransferase [Acidobacteriota bacterium]